MHPTRFQVSRRHKDPVDSKRVCRPSRWGNGFKVDEMPGQTKVLLANFKQAARLLFWSPSFDVIINPYTGSGEVQCVGQFYCNLALPRPEVVVLGR